MPGTVTVACKLPLGLKIRLFDMVDHDEPLLTGGYRTIRQAVPDPKSPIVMLNGSGKRVGKDAAHEIRNGAGLTYGVDADFFAEWMRRNEDFEPVKKGLIFAQAKSADIVAQAKDHASLKTGFEAIDPEGLPPEFKGKIKTADRR